ncbi:kinase-like domain-containing protein [Daedaleopsis nitida]|nr:kinase-like domain-containing protein [Daedaleopsis nitida]
MSTPTFLSAASTACIVAATVVCSLAAGQLEGNHDDARHQTRLTARRATIASLPKKLPNSLMGWRNHAGGNPSRDENWAVLRDTFAVHGYTLWSQFHTYAYFKPGLREGFTDVAQSGFIYATPLRSPKEAGGIMRLYNFYPENHSCHAATADDGRLVVLRILKVGEQGQQHLDVLRYLARGPLSLYSHNHALPLLQEIQVDDMTFGVFPYVGGAVRDAYSCWPKNSVGDLVDMILQMLSALVFIHSHRIAHRDAFKDNFLVEWHPESLSATPSAAVERPRVYLHDFEAAVQFPEGTPDENQVLTGIPMAGIWDDYARPSPPEVLSGLPYDPYKVDVWQLGSSLSDIEMTIVAIDELFIAMAEPDPSKRLSARELLYRLNAVVQAMPPVTLAIPLVVKPDDDSSSYKYPIGTVYSFSDDNGKTYHGKLVKIVESTTGVRIKLQFKDGSVHSVGVDECTKTEGGATMVSETGPAQIA